MSLDDVISVYVFKKVDENGLTISYILTDDKEIKFRDLENLALACRIIPMLTAIRENKKIKLNYNKSDLYENNKDYQDLDQKSIDDIKKILKDNEKIIT